MTTLPSWRTASGCGRRYHDTFLEELQRPRQLVIPRKLDVVTGTLAAPLIEAMARRATERLPPRSRSPYIRSRTASLVGM